MKVLAYRGTERITKQQLRDIRKYFGSEKRSPYHWAIEVEIDQNTGTFVQSLTELFAHIQCTRELNERETQIRERIAKGLTRSYSLRYNSVEENLVDKLMRDAKQSYLKEYGTEPETYGFWNEICLYFGLPLNETALTKSLFEAKQNTKGITKPEKFYEWRAHYPTHSDQDSTYQHYYVKVKDMGYHRDEMKHIYAKFPFVGKVYHCYGENYLQVYVYDLPGRDWAMQHVLHELIKMKLITQKTLLSV